MPHWGIEMPHCDCFLFLNWNIVGIQYYVGFRCHCDCFLKQGLSRRYIHTVASPVFCLVVKSEGLVCHVLGHLRFLTLSHGLGMGLDWHILFWFSCLTKHLTSWFLAPPFCCLSACKCSLICELQLYMNSHLVSWSRLWHWLVRIVSFTLLHAAWQYSRKGREKDSGEYLNELNKGFKPMQVGEKKEELEGRYFCCQA